MDFHHVDSLICQLSVSSALYISCTVISYDYIDSKHNMIEIHREIRELPDRGSGTKKGKRSWDSTWDEWGWEL